MRVGGHVQGFVHLIGKEGKLFHPCGKRRAVQQFGRKQQRPTLDAEHLAVVFHTAYLSRRHTNKRSLPIIVLAASVSQILQAIIAQKEGIDGETGAAVAYGRQRGIVDDADQRMLVSVPDVGVVVVDGLCVQNLGHEYHIFYS